MCHLGLIFDFDVSFSVDFTFSVVVSFRVEFVSFSVELCHLAAMLSFSGDCVTYC